MTTMRVDNRVWPEYHLRPALDGQPNWRWIDLWDQENPQPGREDFESWHAERSKMHDRVWVAHCLPDFLVWDWSDEDVATARRLVAKHVCGVCGRVDDPGCGKVC